MDVTRTTTASQPVDTGGMRSKAKRGGAQRLVYVCAFDAHVSDIPPPPPSPNPLAAAPLRSKLPRDAGLNRLIGLKVVQVYFWPQTVEEEIERIRRAIHGPRDVQ